MTRSMVAEGRTVYAIMNIPFAASMHPMSMVRRHLTSFDIVPTAISLSSQNEGVLVTAVLRKALEQAGDNIDPSAVQSLPGGNCPTVTDDGDPI